MSSLLAKDGLSVVLGAQWGDEGKGKLSDILCGEADVCARCQVCSHSKYTMVKLLIAALGW